MPFFLNDHRIYGRVTVPATAYVEIIHAAAIELWRTDMERVETALRIEHLTIQQPLFITKQTTNSCRQVTPTTSQ